MYRSEVKRRSSKHWVYWWVLLSVVLLVGCRRTTEPTPSPSDTPAVTASALPPTGIPTEAPYAATQTLTTPVGGTTYPYPGPAQPSPQVPLGTSYPGPGGYPAPAELPSATPYPGPSTPFPTPTSPYPGPVLTETAAAITPYPTQTTVSPAQATVSPTQAPSGRPEYPPPTTGTPSQPPATAVGPTPSTPLTPGPSGSPAPSATQAMVRTRLQATDPRTFQIISGQTQLVEFFAYWSPVSRSMAPVVHGLEDRYQDRIRFVYLDIDDPANSLFKSLIDNRLPPLFFLLDGQGNVLAEWQGYVTAEEFENAFSTLGR